MSKSLESVVKEELGLSMLKSVGLGGGGCISQGSTYDTDKYGKVFIKVNSKSGARTMFEGEYASLEALGKPDIVRVPKPYKVVDQPGGGAALVMEYIQFSGGLSKYSALLGQQLARLHLHNSTLEKKAKKAEGHIHKDEASEEYVSQFGFHVNTCCGYLEMDNTWRDDWPSFYADKIEKQISMIEKKNLVCVKHLKYYPALREVERAVLRTALVISPFNLPGRRRTKDGDRQARELWNKILVKWPSFFEGLDIKPSIVHGDLWGGNVSETKDGPVIFDPASFYGHSEYDLGISYLFGGFNSKFYGAYHDVIHKATGFQKRRELYKAFHYLNHWNHFGGGYRGSSISTLKACIDSVYN